MSIKQIIAYNKLRSQLTPEELFAADMLMGANEADKALIIEFLGPQKAGKKASKPKPREYDSCLRCGTTKRDSSHKNKSSADYHEFQSSKDIDFCNRCKGASEVHPIHHNKDFGGYHPFESSKKAGKKSARAQSLGEQIQRRPRPPDNGLSDDEQHAANEALNDITGESHGYGMCAHCPNPGDHNIHHLQNYEGYHEFELGEQVAVVSGD